MARTDTLLVRCQRAAGEGLPEAARRFCAGSGLPLRVQRVAWSPDNRWMYLYAGLDEPCNLTAADVERLRALWQELCPACTRLDVSRLERVQDLPGHSAAATPTRHYVVETDPAAGWEAEIVRWYVEEHMPGLAAVPGCVHALRYLNHDAGPRSHACYALVTEDTLGCPPWLAVRNTDWSSTVRPHFTNTRRTMMHVLA